MRITILGTGTSQGVPVIGCNCEVCTSDDPRDNRLRCSILIEKDDRQVIVDTGPDFRQQCLRYDIADVDALLFTHAHKDHIAGFDELRSIYFRRRSPIPFWATAATYKQLEAEFHYFFSGNYPGRPELNYHAFSGTEQLDVLGFRVQPIPVLHGKMPVHGFRIDDFAYVTDVNHIPEESYQYLQNLDVLILSALRPQPHYSHFTLDEALAEIDKLQPKKAYLTHISHLLGRHDEVEATLPPHVKLAHDGLVLTP